MHAGKLVFSQLMEFLPWRRFDTCVRRYGGDHKVKTFSCGEHLRVMAFAALYKRRWQIELFFKWIKQHLRIKSFYGTSQYAVKAQIWIAVSTYLLVAIVKKRLGIEWPLYTILQILSVSIFEKTPLVELFSQSDYKIPQPTSPNQLLLFE